MDEIINSHPVLPQPGGIGDVNSGSKTSPQGDDRPNKELQP